jgi:hypothetical protein
MKADLATAHSGLSEEQVLCVCVCRVCGEDVVGKPPRRIHPVQVQDMEGDVCGKTQQGDTEWALPTPRPLLPHPDELHALAPVPGTSPDGADATSHPVVSDVEISVPVWVTWSPVHQGWNEEEYRGILSRAPPDLPP